MKLAMMQPAFLPWQGFFELIYHADVFVLLDDFQFSVQSYHQRNRLFVSPGQVGWFTVPVLKSGSFKTAINQARIDDSAPWRKKMLMRLRHSYGKAPFFADIFPLVENWLAAPAVSLAQLNVAFIRMALDLLGWHRKLALSSEHPSPATRSHRVMEILRLHGATRYYAARGSFGYMLEDGVFAQEDIDVQFQNFLPKTYHQAGSPAEFVPFLSVLDALFNAGPAETARLIMQGTEHWLDWDEMVRESQQH